MRFKSKVNSIISLFVSRFALELTFNFILRSISLSLHYAVKFLFVDHGVILSEIK